MTTLTDFLLARIAEDEAVAKGVQEYANERYGSEVEGELARMNLESDDAWITVGVARVLAECKAKRAIVDRHSQCDDVSFGDASTCPDMCALAQPYADHPDFESGWAL